MEYAICLSSAMYLFLPTRYLFAARRVPAIATHVSRMQDYMGDTPAGGDRKCAKRRIYSVVMSKFSAMVLAIMAAREYCRHRVMSMRQQYDVVCHRPSMLRHVHLLSSESALSRAIRNGFGAMVCASPTPTPDSLASSCRPCR